jgi:hypothetical protein
VGLVDLAHPARSDRGSNDVWAEPRAGCDHRRETSTHPIWGRQKTRVVVETGVIITGDQFSRGFFHVDAPWRDRETQTRRKSVIRFDIRVLAAHGDENALIESNTVHQVRKPAIVAQGIVQRMGLEELHDMGLFPIGAFE